MHIHIWYFGGPKNIERITVTSRAQQEDSEFAFIFSAFAQQMLSKTTYIYNETRFRATVGEGPCSEARQWQLGGSGLN